LIRSAGHQPITAQESTSHGSPLHPRDAPLSLTASTNQNAGTSLLTDRAPCDRPTHPAIPIQTVQPLPIQRPKPHLPQRDPALTSNFFHLLPPTAHLLKHPAASHLTQPFPIPSPHLLAKQNPSVPLTLSDGTHQADGEEVHRRQSAEEAAGNQGSAQVGPGHRRSEEAPPLPPRHRCPP
jgi:hypothetical protein